MHQSNDWWLDFFKPNVSVQDVAQIKSMSELVNGCRYICFYYHGLYLIVHYNKYGMASIKALVIWDQDDVVRSVKMQMKWRKYKEAIDKKENEENLRKQKGRKETPDEEKARKKLELEVANLSDEDNESYGNATSDEEEKSTRKSWEHRQKLTREER